MKNEIVLFTDGDLEIEVNFAPDQETVWLSLEQIAELFGRDKSVISRHIANIFREEELVKEVVVAKNATTTKHGAIPGKIQTHFIDQYNLDVIISVGYRVKSKRGITFRKWANSILKDYMLKGYAVNEKRLESLNKTIEIQSKMLASTLGIESEDVYKVVSEYTKALDLLDSYDHQCLKRPDGNDTLYRLSYEECRKLIDSMKFNSDVFGVEKEKGKLNGILEAVYQNVFGVEVYPTIEEKAANLLYFLIKDHPFADGCKRIGATLFLEFLNRNNALVRNRKQVLSDSALVAVTLLIAESKPEEKETMVTLVMNFLDPEFNS